MFKALLRVSFIAYTAVSLLAEIVIQLSCHDSEYFYLYISITMISYSKHTILLRGYACVCGTAGEMKTVN
jgi:hypothetical protein